MYSFGATKGFGRQLRAVLLGLSVSEMLFQTTGDAELSSSGADAGGRALKRYYAIL